MNTARWATLMRAWELPPSESTLHALELSYGERHRQYHTDVHIDACLGHLDRCADEATDLRALELALWFHDAIYRPFRNDNEERSARWMVEFLKEGGIPSAAATAVEALVLATKHTRVPRTSDGALILDIDLAILGSDTASYAAFEAAVWREYRWVPYALYRRRRADILQEFLSRPAIYHHELFRTEREAQARANLQTALVRLRGDA